MLYRIAMETLIPSGLCPARPGRNTSQSDALASSARSVCLTLWSKSDTPFPTATSTKQSPSALTKLATTRINLSSRRPPTSTATSPVWTDPASPRVLDSTPAGWTWTTSTRGRDKKRPSLRQSDRQAWPTNMSLILVHFFSS